MPLRTRLFIIISAIVALILAISLVVVLGNRKKDPSTPTEVLPTTTQEQIINTGSVVVPTVPEISDSVTNGTVTIKEQTTTEAQQNGAKQIAKIFAERYGSYSNENDYQNILEVKEISSVSMWTELSKLMQNKQNASSYFGVTTRGATMKLTKWSDSAASVTVSTVRAETQNGKTTNKEQDAKVTLIKIGKEWLVDSFSWQ